MRAKQSDYVLGHTEREQLRLIRQARLLAPFTERHLRAAGITLGMRVLDIGCGMGDVAMLAAELVGPTGSVVSIDIDQASVETARKRALSVGLENTAFYREDLQSFADPKPFDAIVGRLVLEFLPDTTAIISHLCGMLKPGGVIALQEPTWKIWLAYTSHLPLRTAVTTVIRDTFVAGGVNTEMELPIYQAFRAADLTSPQLHIDVPLGDSPEFRNLLHDMLLAVWSRAEAFRLPLESLGDPTTLASRLDDELDANRSFASFVGLVSVFARKRVG
jgi:ubiquinone/menaquinone biosynthesis C-methylase UbiE